MLETDVRLGEWATTSPASFSRRFEPFLWRHWLPPPSPSVLSAPLHSAIVLLNILYLAIPFNDDKMNDYYHWISNQWLFWYRSNIIRPLAFYPTEDCTASIHWESQLDYITSNLFTTHRSGFVFLRGGDVTVNTQSIINYICYDDLTATLLQPYGDLWSAFLTRWNHLESELKVCAHFQSLNRAACSALLLIQIGFSFSSANRSVIVDL